MSLTKWRNLPGAPQKADLVAWQVFVEENGLGMLGRKPSKEREDELTKRVRNQNRLLEIEIAQKENKLVERDGVNALMFQICHFAKITMFQKLENELPAKAAGLLPEEIRMVARGIGDEICDLMRVGFGEWQRKQPLPDPPTADSLSDKDTFNAVTTIK